MKGYKHEVIICVVNSGFSEAVMDAARELGARGGTVIRGRGTANAEADANNYRSNKTFEPTQEYDPELDKNYVGFVKLEGYTNDRVVFNQDTDLIPLTGFTGSVGLLDYLYPYESDEPWTGARLQLSEGETDYDGSPVSGCNFTVL